MATQVWLHPRRLLPALRSHLFRSAHACVRSTWPDAPRVSTDALLGFQLGMAGEEAASGAALNASAKAWAVVLTRFGAAGAATVEAVRTLLLAEAQVARAQPQRSPQPHASVVANAEAVRASLVAAGPQLARLWRDI